MFESKFVLLDGSKDDTHMTDCDGFGNSSKEDVIVLIRLALYQIPNCEIQAIFCKREFKIILFIKFKYVDSIFEVVSDLRMTKFTFEYDDRR